MIAVGLKRQGGAAPEQTPARGDRYADAAKIAGKEDPDHVGGRNPDKGFGGGGFQTAQHALDAHAGVHHHGYRADLEEGEDQYEKIDPRFDHQHRPGASDDADLIQPPGKIVGFAVELFKGQMAVAPATATVTAGCAHYRAFVRHPRRRMPQTVGNVDPWGLGGGDRFRHSSVLSSA